MEKLKFRVADYGAVGDGVTDDGPAISRAAAAAAAAAGEKAVVFEPKTYRILDLPAENRRHCLFSFEGTTDLHIEGNGAVLLFKGANRLLSLEGGRRFSLDGLTVDYQPKPFILAKAEALDMEQGYMDMAAEEDIGLQGETYLPPPPCFMFPNRADIRYHYFIREIRRLGDKRYRLVIRSDFIERMGQVKPGDEFLLPTIGGSHLAGAACTIYDTDGFTLSNLRFYSHPEFGFDVRDCRGEMRFDHVALRQKEGAREQLVSWRDGFHIKDNRDPIVWDSCDIGPIGDDAFNLSCVHLDVTEVSADERGIRCLPAEKGKTRDIAPGDEFVAYDLETGRAFGEARVARVFPSSEDVGFEADRPLTGFRPGMQVAFYKFANPGFVVRNSTIEGTVRVRSSGVFENCRFDVFWVHVENEFFVEGPIPKDITFRNCTFTTPYDADAKIFHVGTLGKNGLHNCAYKCKNIVLENCTFEKGTIDVEDGNELIIR